MMRDWYELVLTKVFQKTFLLEKEAKLPILKEKCPAENA